MVVFDATALLLLVAPHAATPRDSSGKAITYAKERLDGELQALAKAKVKIIVPTPALSEVLVRAGATAANEYLRIISRSSRFRVVAFDERAAIEVALMTQAAIKKGDKKAGSKEVWAKVKYDRQIIAIAKVEGAGTIYTDDKNLRAFASANGIRTTSVAELQIPEAQMPLELEGQPVPAAIAGEPSIDDAP